MISQRILEGDTAVGLFDILHAPPAELVQLTVVDLQPCGQHVHHHAQFHRLLEHQPGDAVFAALDRGPQGGHQRGRQEVCDLLADDVVTVAADGLLHELISASAGRIGKSDLHFTLGIRLDAGMDAGLFFCHSVSSIKNFLMMFFQWKLKRSHI